ncbi:MAG TPA: hypothetical protein VHL11_10960, partial [Phototrophicaceae bacterium]|nr:hypothetical protein [Phototrophicaceae bacterium]
MRRFKTGMILSSFLLLLSIIPVYAETNRVDDDGQMSFFSPQIVYNVSGDQISATFQVNYRNDSYEDRVSFALLIPVPAEPESVETVDPLGDQYGADGWIDHDQGLGGAPLYSIHVTPPSTVYCNYLFGDTYNYNLGSGSAPLDYPEFSRYSVLAGDEVDQWLSNNEYTLDERQTALLPEYIAQGYSMVALGFDAL